MRTPWRLRKGKAMVPDWMEMAAKVDYLVYACLAYPVLRRGRPDKPGCSDPVDMVYRCRGDIDTLRGEIVRAFEEMPVEGERDGG